MVGSAPLLSQKSELTQLPRCTFDSHGKRAAYGKISLEAPEIFLTAAEVHLHVIEIMSFNDGIVFATVQSPRRCSLADATIINHPEDTSGRRLEVQGAATKGVNAGLS